MPPGLEGRELGGSDDVDYGEFRAQLVSEGRSLILCGPTGTGKTHLAIERMLGHESGIISAAAFSFIVQDPRDIIAWARERSLFSSRLI